MAAKVNYAVRPAKAVQRKMLCDLLTRLGRIERLDRYRYIGFGGIGFMDHALFHRRLGIRNMLSIEEDDKWRGRLGLNRPFECIEMEWRPSHECLVDVGWRKRTILWLDYECKLNGKVLSDIETAVVNLRSGSFLCVTVNAHPPQAPGDKDVVARRLQKFTSLVGEERLPLGIRGMDLTRWGWATKSWDVIDAAIRQVLQHRNGPTPLNRLLYRQLIHIIYADGQKMLTVGGFIGDAKEHERLEGEDGLADLGFIRRDGQPALHIEIPSLSLRELRYLSQKFPRAPADARKLKLPEEEVLKFRAIYRYYAELAMVESF